MFPTPGHTWTIEIVNVDSQTSGEFAFTVTAAATGATTFSFSPTTRTVSESAGSTSFTLTRSSGSVAQTVFISTTQTEGFTNNNDYTSFNNQALAFAVGETSKTLTITLTNDATVEPDETFGLIVQQNSSDPVGTFLAKATFTITNDDSETATFSFSPTTRTVSESAGSTSFTLTRSSGSVAQTVFISTTQTEGFTNNNDYTSFNNQALAFAVGETSKTLTITLTNDATVEPSETFGLIAQQNSSDPVGTFLAKATFTITNDD